MERQQLLPIIAFCVVVSAGGMLFGCTETSPPCGPFEKSKQDIIVTGIRNIQLFQVDEDQSDNLVLTDAETAVTLDEVEFHVDMNFTVQAKKSANSIRSLVNWVMPTAHACSPPRDGDVRSRLHNIELLSTGNLSADFPAGQSLSALFDIAESRIEDVFYGYDGTQQLTNMSSIGERTPRMMLKFKIKHTKDSPLSATIPDQRAIHSFTLLIELRNGESYSAESNPVSLPMYR